MFHLDTILTEKQRLALVILDEVERVDRRVAAWMSAPTGSRGPRPLCDARVAGLLDQASRLLSR